MEIRHRAVAIALLVTFGAPVPGKADKIDDYITAQIKRLHVPGASLAIVRDGHITKAQGYGFANLELRSPATERNHLRNRFYFEAVYRHRNHDAGRRR